MAILVAAAMSATMANHNDGNDSRDGDSGTNGIKVNDGDNNYGVYGNNVDNNDDISDSGVEGFVCATVNKPGPLFSTVHLHRTESVK